MIELEKENEELRERIESMEAELNALRKTPNGGHRDRERVRGNTPGRQLASPAPSASVNCETCVVGKDCTCLNDVAGADTQTKQAPDDMNAVDNVDNDDTCGLCAGTSCLCEELGIRNRSAGAKRKRSKSHETTSSNAQLFPVETDFTSSFHCTTPPNRLPGGTCGFCSDLSTCVCLGAPLQSVQTDEHAFATITSGVNSCSESQAAAETPISGDGESRNQPGNRVTLHLLMTGTCIQCRSDPISTLFCQTLSRRLESPVPLPLPSQQQSSTDQRPTQSTYLQCSAVYQTLSRHRNFDKMSLEVIVDGLARGEHRGMEFTVGGVHGLLREMDRGEASQNKDDT